MLSGFFRRIWRRVSFSFYALQLKTLGKHFELEACRTALLAFTPAEASPFSTCACVCVCYESDNLCGFHKLSYYLRVVLCFIIQAQQRDLKLIDEAVGKVSKNIV